MSRFEEGPEREPKPARDVDREIDRRREEEMEDRPVCKAVPLFRCAICGRLTIGTGPLCQSCQPPTPAVATP